MNRTQLPIALAIGLIVGLFSIWRAIPLELFSQGITDPGADLAQALSGALAYASDDQWRFPLFDVEGMTALGRQNIIFTDSVPGLSLLYRLAGADVDTVDRTFVTTFMAVSFLMQGVAAALAGHLIGIRNPFALAGTALIVACWPAFLFRIAAPEHLALMGHWVVILAVAAMLMPYREGRLHMWVWLLLSCASLLTHPYLFVMVAICFLGRIGMEIVAEDRTVQTSSMAVSALVFLGTSLAMMFVFGHMGTGTAEPGSYSSYFTFNIASPAMPAWTSLIVPEWGEYPMGQIEGYVYFGVAGLGLCLLALAGAFRGPQPGERPRLTRNRALMLALFCTVVTFYAIGEKWYFAGTYLFDAPMPGLIKKIGESFRGHGRFFWIVSYIAILIAAATVALRFGRAGAFAVFAAGIIAQVEMTPLYAKAVPLKNALVSSADIAEVIEASSAVSVYPPFACDGSAGPMHHALQLVTVRNGGGLANDFVSARPDPATCIASPLRKVIDGVPPGETAVVFVDEEVRLYALYADPGAREQCRMWGRLALCRENWDEIEATFSPLDVERFALPLLLTFERGNRDTRVLVKGFSGTEPWGTWSIGSHSEIVVPLAPRSDPRRVRLDMAGFMPQGREAYTVTVTLRWSDSNGPKGSATRQVTFEPNDAGRRTVEIAPNESIEDTTVVTVEIDVPAPLSPLDAGFNDDPRPLGVSIFTLSME